MTLCKTYFLFRQENFNEWVNNLRDKCIKVFAHYTVPYHHQHILQVKERSVHDTQRAQITLCRQQYITVT